jgi:hypothetical protein
VKQLLNFSNDDPSQKSQSLYARFQSHLRAAAAADQQAEKGTDQWQNESIYLANFASLMQ